MSKLLELGPVLIANRGEIACRVIRSAKALGYATIAVYSEADVAARHVGLADFAVCIGPAAASESYLCIESIIAAARRSGARSIHPGYGFLSENAAFASACEEAGIVFIGPSTHAIEVMGNKATSKRAMIEAGVPCIPGYQGRDQSDATLVQESKAIGFPLMVKAAAGGGGRGMRLVHAEAELVSAIQAARSEALNSFGSEELIIERAVIEPRHVEIQVFADSQGNTVHLFERDCSVQRRHQKVLEEAPSPAVCPQIRAAMGQAAISAAQSVDYVGAGTVEFLLDKEGQFYFLEMNTRLQVEHPVTEMITGLDLVEWQLRIAAGEPLPLAQDDLAIEGHAIEARLYAEDPANGFLPAAGTALLWEVPEGQGVRVDHGLLSKQEVSSFYDPMIAKVIAHGKTREEARRRLVRALVDTQILGFPTNREFLCAALSHEQFCSGDFPTAFIEKHFPEEELKAEKPGGADYALVAALLCRLRQEEKQQSAVLHLSGIEQWSNNKSLNASLLVRIGDEEARALKVYLHNSAGRYRVDIDGEEVSIVIHSMDENRARVEIDGMQETIHFACVSSDSISIGIGSRTLNGEDILLSSERVAAAEDDGSILAPMHGNILAVHVSEGQVVEKGDFLLVLEAMKMEHKVTASISGTVTNLSAREGQQVALNKILLEIIPPDDAGNG